MKTKLLKKVRRYYSWKWDNTSGQWIIVDKKGRRNRYYHSAAQFLITIAYEMIGLRAGANYEIHITKRDIFRLHYKPSNLTIVKH